MKKSSTGDDDYDDEHGNINFKGSSSKSWSRLKDPRIVRVSRAFGGKDRHSKVLTVKGLRDRRIRLSVPTAVQLYDLQERLGLNQPSKVIDWLLNAAKTDIDELPPLQFPYPYPYPYPYISTSATTSAAYNSHGFLKLSPTSNFIITDHHHHKHDEIPSSTLTKPYNSLFSNLMRLSTHPPPLVISSQNEDFSPTLSVPQHLFLYQHQPSHNDFHFHSTI